MKMCVMKKIITMLLLMSTSPSQGVKLGQLRSHHSANQADEVQVHERFNPTDDTIATRIKESIHDTIAKQKNEMCDDFKTIEIAVAYDSAYAAEMLSMYFRTPEIEINNLFTKVSKRFQNQEVCLRTKLTHLEGDYDIMKEKNSPQDHLIDFQNWFNRERPDVDRTVSLLFTGKMMENKYSSISYKGQLCRPKNAFGVFFMDPKKQNLEEKVSLVVHQLAHIIGLEDSNHLMNRQCFSQESVQVLKSILENETCLKTEPSVMNQFHFDDIPPEISK